MKIEDAIVHQFHAGLKMLEKTIELCPEPLWLTGSGASANRTWHIAYHALYATHLYLSPSLAEFAPWEKHRRNYNFFVAVPGQTEDPYLVDVAYTQADLLEYAELCHREVDFRTARLDLDAPSGFFWLPFDKLELQFYNLRLLALHVGQLSERIRCQANVGIGWVR